MTPPLARGIAALSTFESFSTIVDPDSKTGRVALVTPKGIESMAVINALVAWGYLDIIKSGEHSTYVVTEAGAAAAARHAP